MVNKHELDYAFLKNNYKLIFKLLNVKITSILICNKGALNLKELVELFLLYLLLSIQFCEVTIYGVASELFLLCRFVCGILMDGKNRRRDSCSFLPGGLRQHSQIRAYSFIKIKYSSWSYMKLSSPFSKQLNSSV